MDSVDVRMEATRSTWSLIVQGEIYVDDVVQAGVPGPNMADWRVRLGSNLDDFVAESRVGWRQNQDDTPRSPRRSPTGAIKRAALRNVSLKHAYAPQRVRSAANVRCFRRDP